jgi:AcrR family transcriptional regulator
MVDLEQCSLSNDVLSLDRRTSQPSFDTGTLFQVSTETRDDAPDGAGLPAVPLPPWQRLPERSARRRREPISRDAIVDAAIALLDRDGLDALSMRALAEQLGTGAASLYWHVGSKDGLLDLVLDKLIGEVAIPDADPARWREQVKEVARNQRVASLRHPYLVRVSIGRIPMGPNAIRLSERVLAIMRAGGLPPRMAVQGHLLLISTINGFTLDETGVGDPPGAGPDGTPTPREAGEMASAYLRSLPPAHFPNLVELAGEYTQVDDDARFDLLIDIFVDGLARAAASARAAAAG